MTEWYEDESDAATDYGAICRVMREIADDDKVHAPDEWERFARWVHTEALDQEVFGEYLRANPEALHVAWYAYLDATEKQAAGT